jgi:hypothetical protein
MTAGRATHRARWRLFEPTVVVAVVVLASLPYLLGVISTGVLGFNSGLATIPLGPWLGAHPGLPWLDPNVGFVSQALGHLSALDVLHWHLPWWNPYEAVGVPLAGEGQSAALFPLTPLLALATGQLYFHIILEGIAGLATQRLLKEMGLARWVTVVGGILFALNGTFAWLTNAAFNPVAFLPVILWGIERCRNRSLLEGWSGWLLIAFGLSMSVYAGFPETAYLDGLLALVWAVVRFLQQPEGRRALYAATVSLGGVIGLLVSAPFFAAFSSATTNADVGGHAKVFATAHLPGQAVNTLGLPYLYGPLFGFNATTRHVSLNALWGTIGGYVTAAVILLALVGLLAGRDRGLRILLAAWIAVVMAKSFGWPPVVTAVNHIPGISAIAFERYAPPSWEMALIVLAAMGLQAIGAPDQANPRRVKAALALAGSVTALVVGLELFDADGLLQLLDKSPNFTYIPIVAEFWALSTVVLVVVVGLWTRPAVAQVAIGLILVVEALAMFMLPEQSAPTQIPLDMRPVTFLQHHLGLERFVTLGPIVPNYGSYFHIAEADAHDLPIPADWAAFVHRHLEPNERPQQFNGVTSLNPKERSPVQELEKNLTAYEAIGVKYVVAPEQWAGLPGKVVFHDRYTAIWELATPAPFYWVLSGSCHLHGISFDEARVTCSRPSEVVRGELMDPGWTAEANGAPVPMSRIGPLFGMVRLPAGTYTLTFNYLPPEMGLCADLVVLGVLAGILAAAVPIVLHFGRCKSRGRHAAGRARGAATPDRPTAPTAPSATVASEAFPPVAANGHAANGHAANGTERIPVTTRAP